MHPAPSRLLSCLIAALPLAAQQSDASKAPPRVQQPTLLTRDAEQQRSLGGSRQRPVASAGVLIQGRAIVVPVPPLDARTAKAKLGEVLAGEKEDLAVIDRELEGLYRDQKAQVAELRAAPDKAREGMDTDAFRDLRARLKDQDLGHWEAKLAEGTRGLVARLLDQRSKDSEVARNYDESEAAYDPYGENVRDQRDAMHQAIFAWEGTAFLKGYQPLWQDYGPRLDAYVKGTVDTLGALDLKPQPPSIQLLARTLKIQLFERMRGLIGFNGTIWTLTAGTVHEKRYYNDVAHSEMIPKGGFPLPENF